MAVGDVRAIAPIVFTPTTTRSTFLTVPPDKEWTIRFLRATNVTNSAAAITVSLGTEGAAQIAHNEVLPAPTASAMASKNILGPDFITLPPGLVMQARAGSDNSVRLVAGITERDLT